MRRSGLRAPEHALEADVEHAVDLVLGHVDERRIVEMDGIVDQDVEPARFSDKPFHRLKYRGAIRYVALVRRLAVDIHARHVRAFARERVGDRAADTGARPGHKRSLACQSSHRSLSLSGGLYDHNTVHSEEDP